MNLQELLSKLSACQEAKEWAGEQTIEQIVANCHRGDWLLWLAKKVDMDLQTLTLAKALCVKIVIHLMKDERSINAVLVAEKFGRGEATMDELNTAAAAAYAAAAAAAADADAAAAYAAAAYAAAADAYAAAAYAAAAAADADAYAAAAYAAAADAYAADADAYAADADAYAAAYADSRTKNQLQTADICREIFGQKLIELVNNKLA